MSSLPLAIAHRIRNSDVSFTIRHTFMPTSSDASVGSATGSVSADCALDLGLLLGLAAVRVLGTPGDDDIHCCEGLLERIEGGGLTLRNAECWMMNEKGWDGGKMDDG